MAGTTERIGRYELGRCLGRGGSGEVHEAVRNGPGAARRSVAVKVLRDGAGGLVREARLGGLLRHRHLVDVFEVGCEDGRWFCAMELCTGGALAGRVLPPRAVVEVGLAVCEALHYAHQELGLVHLDLKPANLLVEEGEVKVADLGVARARGFADDGRVRGTVGYLAPELLRGGTPDARADLYSLGVTLVELATSGRPGAPATVPLAIDPAEGAPADLEAVPAWLAPAVDRCLAPLLYAEALALHARVGDRRGAGIVLGNLGILRRDEGRWADAVAQFEEALAVHREVGNRRSEGVVLANLGDLRLAEHATTEAAALLHAALAAHREVGHRRAQGSVLGQLAELDAAAGDGEGATGRLAEAEALLRAVGDPTELAVLVCRQARVRHALGEPGAGALLAEAEAAAAALPGRYLPLDRELARTRAALSETGGPGAAPDPGAPCPP